MVIYILTVVVFLQYGATGIMSSRSDTLEHCQADAEATISEFIEHGVPGPDGTIQKPLDVQAKCLKVTQHDAA